MTSQSNGYDSHELRPTPRMSDVLHQVERSPTDLPVRGRYVGLHERPDLQAIVLVPTHGGGPRAGGLRSPLADVLEMRELFSAVPESLALCQPSQRSLVLDERRVVAEHLPPDNLMRGVVGFEQSRTPDDLARVARVLDGWLDYPADADLGLAFRDWMAATVVRMVPSAPAELGRTLKEATMTLAERMAEWPKQWHQEGLAQGRREGVAHQSALLRRLAAARFGDAVGDEVRSLLVGTTTGNDSARSRN